MDSKRRSVLIATAVVVAVIAVVVVVVQFRGTGSDDASSPTSSVLNDNTGPAGDVPRRPAGDPMVLGKDDAPVTMVVFSELTCPYCIHFSTEIQPQLVDRYVKVGKLRIEWRDAPASGPTARLTARAGRAAAAQERFWPFVDAVVRADQRTPLTVDRLVRLADAAGVKDLDRFRDDATGNSFDGEIDSDLKTAQRLFIPPSPAFWVDGTPLLSGLPIQAFIDVIDGKLKLSSVYGG